LDKPRRVGTDILRQRRDVAASCRKRFFQKAATVTACESEDA
jgi:hypothetical protein